MSRAADSIKSTDVSLVIPYASKLFYSAMAHNDNALCFLINKGYIEADSYNVCHSLSVFLDLTLKEKFLRVGDIEKIRLKSNNKIVYRQRVYFSSLSELFPIMKNFSITLRVCDSFKIGIIQMSRCYKEVKNLEEYLLMKNLNNYTLDDWLTDACLAQLSILCEIEGVNLIVSKSKDALFKRGILARAPYICGSFSIEKKTSSFIVPPENFLIYKDCDGKVIDLLVDECENRLKSKKYVVKTSGKKIPIYGYTQKNIQEDKKLGVLKDEH